MKVKKLGSVGLAFLSAFVLSYLFAFYNELVCAQVWLTEQPVWEIFKQTKQAFHSHSLFLIFFVLFVCLFFLFSDFKRTTTFLFTYRYPIAFAVFVLCVLLQLNGSSIGSSAMSFPGSSRYCSLFTQTASGSFRLRLQPKKSSSGSLLPSSPEES